jgi:hypothetical protein
VMKSGGTESKGRGLNEVLWWHLEEMKTKIMVYLRFCVDIWRNCRQGSWSIWWTVLTSGGTEGKGHGLTEVLFYHLEDLKDRILV